MLGPEVFDSRVRVVPFRDGRAEIAEKSVGLGGRGLGAWHRKRATHVGGQRSGSRIGSGRHRQPEAPQIVVLIVVAVPAAVVLDQVHFELDSLGERNRLLGRKYGLARLVTASWAEVD